jgi:Polyketide cyclase / dehydrase and lipid transport
LGVEIKYMKTIRVLLVWLVGFVALAFCISFLFPSQVKIERGTVIHASPEKIQAALHDFKKWPEWNPLLQFDTGAVITFSEPSIGRGAWLEWESTANKKVSKVEMISDSSYGVGLMMQLYGQRAMPSEIRILPIETNEGHYQVTWTYYEKLKWYPWEKFFAIVADKLRGPILEAGMSQLKEYVEGNG